MAIALVNVATAAASAASRQMMLSYAYTLGLRPFGTHFLDEFDLIAFLEMVEWGGDHILAIKIKLAPIRADDETVTIIGMKLDHVADVFRHVSLGFAAQAASVVLKLSPRGIEGIAQGHIDVLVMVAVDDNFISGHAEIDTHVKLFALMMMLVRHLHHYAAGNNVLEKLVKLFGLVADVRFQSLGRRDVANSDLQGDLHVFSFV